MRVLHVFKTYWPDTFGGIERVIHGIVRNSAPHGVQSEVLSLSRHPQERSLEFDGHSATKAKLDFDVASTGFSGDILRLFRERGAEADIIHYHFPWPFMDLIHFAARLRKPTLVTYHSDIVKQKLLLQAYRPLMHGFLGSVDRIVATSSNYLRTSQTLANHAEKTTVIAPGLSRADYPPADEEVRRHWRARLPPQGFFLFTGVFRYYKGLPFLLEAARLCGLPVVLIGTGPMEEALRDQALRLELSDVVFVGAVSERDKIALLESCRAVILPSHLRSEAFGLSLVEAAMFGKPMISCDIGTGTSFVNLDGETGIVTQRADPEALAAAMQAIWSDDAASAAFSANALKRYEALFTGERMGLEYARAYSRLLDERSDPGELAPCERRSI